MLLRGDRREAEVARDGFAIEREAAAGERARSRAAARSRAGAPRRSRSQSRANISK